MTTITIDDRIGNIDIDGDGFGRRGCDWDDSVCTEMATYRIAFRQPEGSDRNEVKVFCQRHYAVWLARFITLHPLECHHSINSHIAEYGLIGNQKKLVDKATG